MRKWVVVNTRPASGPQWTALSWTTPTGRLPPTGRVRTISPETVEIIWKITNCFNVIMQFYHWKKITYFQKNIACFIFFICKSVISIPFSLIKITFSPKDNFADWYIIKYLFLLQSYTGNTWLIIQVDLIFT